MSSEPLIEEFGPSYWIEKVLEMRLRTREAVHAIAANAEVGMTEYQAIYEDMLLVD
jgi:hypothetical protein